MLGERRRPEGGLRRDLGSSRGVAYAASLFEGDEPKRSEDLCLVVESIGDGCRCVCSGGDVESLAL